MLETPLLKKSSGCLIDCGILHFYEALRFPLHELTCHFLSVIIELEDAQPIIITIFEESLVVYG